MHSECTKPVRFFFTLLVIQEKVNVGRLFAHLHTVLETSRKKTFIECWIVIVVYIERC